MSPTQPLTFCAYNRVFGEDATSSQVYMQSLQKCVHRTLEGENVTVMAYGQTGSGKTYTMVGSESNPGILPLGIQDLFRLAEESENYVKITVTVLEIYGEEVHDLCAEDTSCPVRVVEIDGVTTPVGVLETAVTSSEQALNLQQRAVGRRVVEATNMNAHSSRSHVVVTFHVSSTTRESDATTSLASLTFVDLAGSERLAKTGLSHSAKAGKQGVQINMGLLCLSKVIKAVANDPKGHAPFRDSKLTRILKPSFGGNAVTLFLANITPAPEHYAETVSTLRYSCLAAGVVNSVVKNEDATTRMRRELADLKRVGKMLTKEAREGGKYVHITREEVERVELSLLE